MSNQRYVSDTLKQKKKKRTKLFVYLSIVLCLILIYGIIYVIRLPKFKITDIQINGTVFFDVQDIESQINTLLEKNTLWVIPHNNIFLFSKSKALNQIKQNPAILNANVNKKFFNTLHITIEEQEKQALYCHDDSYTKCFYTNPQGMIYAPTEGFVVPEQEIIIYTEGNQYEVQNKILDDQIYVGMMQFIKSVAQAEIKIGKVIIKQDGVIELWTRSNVLIKVSIFDDFKKDFTNFIALFEQNILTLEAFETLEYVDLRFGNKVFYKNKTN